MEARKWSCRSPKHCFRRYRSSRTSASGCGGLPGSQATVTALALAAGIGLALIAEPLVLLALGERWQPAVAVVQVLASVTALQTLGRLGGPLAMATGETRLLFRRSLQMFLLRLPLISIGMYFWGLSGLLLGRFAAGIAAIFINMHMVRTLIGVSFLEQLRATAGPSARR